MAVLHRTGTGISFEFAQVRLYDLKCCMHSGWRGEKGDMIERLHCCFGLLANNECGTKL